MRELNDIQKDIDAITSEYYDIANKMILFKTELRERLFYDFCNKYGIKAGDIVKAKNYAPFQIIKIHPLMDGWIICKQFESDGTLKRYTCVIPQTDIEGCEVIGHIELEP